MTEQFPNDKSLLWSYRLDGKGSGSQQGRHGDPACPTPSFNWFHLQANELASIDWMKEESLHPDVVESLTQTDTRPGAVALAGGYLIYLRGVNSNPGADPEDMVALRIWFNETTIITARHRDRRVLSVEDVRLRITKGTGPKTTGGFVCMLIEYLANRIGNVVDDIDEVLTKTETSLGDDDVRAAQQQLFLTRKQSAAIRRYLAPQKEALVELCRSRHMFSESEIHDLIHQSDRITHYIEDLDHSRERALLMQSDLQNRLAEIQNDRIYLLSIVATIFLPLSFITGVFGMNVGGMPGVDNSNFFVYLSIGMTGLALLLLLLMRWKNWL